MSKFGLYTNGTLENRSYVMSTHIGTLQEARAYFMGMKRLSVEQFDKMFHVEIVEDNKTNKNLLFGNK